MKTLYIKLGILVIIFLNVEHIVAQENPAPGRSVEVREVTVSLPHIDERQTLEVAVVDGLAILEGDIVLGRIEDLQSGRGGARITSNAAKWPNGVIPYEIPSGVSQADRRVVMQAINEVNSSTNLTLRRKTGSDTDYVRFDLSPSHIYSSYIGRVGNQQTITVRTGGSHPRKGKIIHEIGHAAGLYHEHTRVDRDSSITVDFSNIHPGMWTAQYRKYTSNSRYSSAGGRDEGGYDYESIMHYGDGRGSAGAIDPSRPIITTIPPGQDIGQRRGLSAGDIRTINAIYPTSADTEEATEDTTDVEADRDGETNDLSSSNAIDIRYPVQLVPQTTSVSCWAASAAMVVGWREHYSMTPEDIARPTGGWERLYRVLPPDDTNMFSVWGLHYEQPQSYTVEGFAELLRNGPLWVATDVSGGDHVVVISAMRGDGSPDGTVLTIMDPMDRGATQFRPSNSGSTYQLTYREFTQGQEALARRESTEPTAYYVAY